MAGNRDGKAERGAGKKRTWWVRTERFLAAFNKTITYVIGLPAVGLIGTLLASHFQYVAAYQDKVQAVGKQQMDAAEQVFTDASSTFSRAITLQQILYFNYHDANLANRPNDPQSLEAQSARAVYPEYVKDRTDLRENIDFLARRVELDIDWASNTKRDAAHGGAYGVDAMSRIALGKYNFDCDSQANMPTFAGKAEDLLKAQDNNGHINPKLPVMRIDWFSVKHQLLTLFYCFEIDQAQIIPARQWAAGNTPTPTKLSDKQIGDSLDNEAVRLHDFLTLGARRIEKIRVKFRPRG